MAAAVAVAAVAVAVANFPSRGLFYFEPTEVRLEKAGRGGLIDDGLVKNGADARFILEHHFQCGEGVLDWLDIEEYPWDLALEAAVLGLERVLVDAGFDSPGGDFEGLVEAFDRLKCLASEHGEAAGLWRVGSDLAGGFFPCLDECEGGAV